jgi:pimeloyl-ACP methyl ester carboxylesterase
MEFTSTLPTYFNPSTCVRKGLCPVTTKSETHSLYFEQHGRGEKYKIIFIMGLNASSFGWKEQVDWFGGGKAFKDGNATGEGEQSTVLVFDNRGVGNSGYPRGPYTTSGMAEDVIRLLDYVGWRKEREVHVVGISLGGMIAQGGSISCYYN